MQLNVNDDLVVDNPDIDLIREEIDLMLEDHFIILTRSEQVYMQACRNEDGDFQLEYRAGHPDEHYETAKPAGIDDVEQAFIRYASNMDAWASAVEVAETRSGFA